MKPPLVMECAWCRAFFEAKRQHAKTCSPKCRQAWVRGLRKAREEAAAVLAQVRAERAAQQMSLPGMDDAEPVSAPSPLGNITPESVTLPALERSPVVPTEPPVPAPAAGAGRAAQPEPARNGPKQGLEAIDSALRRIIQTARNDAM